VKKIEITKTIHATGAESYSYPVDMSTVSNVQYAADRSYAIGDSDNPALPEATEAEIQAVLLANAPVPRKVTMRQARLALLQQGLLSQIDTVIDSLPEPDKSAARVEWDHSSAVDRAKPFVVMLAPALGLSDTQLDDLFRYAATL